MLHKFYLSDTQSNFSINLFVYIAFRSTKLLIILVPLHFLFII